METKENAAADPAATATADVTQAAVATETTAAAASAGQTATAAAADSSAATSTSDAPASTTTEAATTAEASAADTTPAADATATAATDQASAADASSTDSSAAAATTETAAAPASGDTATTSTDQVAATAEAPAVATDAAAQAAADELVALQAEVADRDAKLVQAEEEAADLKRQLVELNGVQARNNELAFALSDKAATVVRLDATIEELRAKLDTTQTENRDGAALELELAEAKAEIARLKLAAVEAAADPDDPVTRDFVGKHTKDKSCAFAHARSNEPVFVIRGQDPMAGPLVRLWVSAARMMGVAEEKAGQALSVADELDAWPRKKRPD